MEVEGYDQKIPAVLIMLRNLLLGESAYPSITNPPPWAMPLLLTYMPISLPPYYPPSIFPPLPAKGGLKSVGIFRLAPEKETCDLVKEQVRW